MTRDVCCGYITSIRLRDKPKSNSKIKEQQKKTYIVGVDRL